MTCCDLRIVDLFGLLWLDDGDVEQDIAVWASPGECVGTCKLHSRFDACFYIGRLLHISVGDGE